MPLAGRREIVPRKPDQGRWFKGLIFAPPGHGKTRLLGTAQEDERTYPMAFLNWDSGEDTLAGLDIDVFDIQEPGDFDSAYDQIKRSGEYRSVGVDSITETQINSLFHILDMDRNRADPDLLAQQDWGIVLIQMRRIVRKFMKALPMHTFMTALSDEQSIKGEGIVKVPKVQGSFADELPGIPNVVAYMAKADVEVDEEHPTGEQRILLMHSYPKFLIKTRTPWNTTVPSEIEDPTVTKILDALGYQE